jgi:acyl transferase domain
LDEGVRGSCVNVFGKGVRRCVGFTGQGSQWVGMGRDVLEKVPGVGERMKEVKEVLDIDIDQIMLSSDEVML